MKFAHRGPGRLQNRHNSAKVRYLWWQSRGALAALPSTAEPSASPAITKDSGLEFIVPVAAWTYTSKTARLPMAAFDVSHVVAILYPASLYDSRKVSFL